ncbi:hypothetical protein, partial [Mesorhizobium japonicum]|uniref:DUF7882 family protein n=1 Tax=Mesorhizobium japonicum TaxID=2066070 RepID=UPI003B59A307
DDRVLAHLQIVIGNKVRRGESFHLTWHDDVSVGSGRTIVWVHPRGSLVYKFFGSKTPEINRHWIDVLMDAANSASGLRIVPEPGAAGHGAGGD